jgi:thioredoxin 1
MNPSEFQPTLTQTDKPVIVDFWAPWCLPCRMTKPILEKLAQEYAQQVTFLPLNADAAPEVLQQFQVIGIPTVLALRDGNVVARITGAQNEAGYRALFEALAAGKALKIPRTIFDRLLRLGAGMALILIGISVRSWLVVGAGAFIAFLGVYDRCPVWQAITGALRKTFSSTLRE